VSLEVSFSPTPLVPLVSPPAFVFVIAASTDVIFLYWPW
jgi:hypothetical protein